MAEKQCNLIKNGGGMRTTSLAPYTSNGTVVYQSSSYGNVTGVSYTVPRRARYRITLYTDTQNTPTVGININGYDFDKLYQGSPIGTMCKDVKADCEQGDIISFYQENRQGYNPASYVVITEY